MATKHFIKNTLALLLLITSTMAFAQQQAWSPAQYAQFETQWMQQYLALTDNQAKKVNNIVLHFAQLDGISVTDKKANARDKDADLRAVLTSGQYHAYHDRRQEMYTQELKQMVRDQKK